MTASDIRVVPHVEVPEVGASLKRWAYLVRTVVTGTDRFVVMWQSLDDLGVWYEYATVHEQSIAEQLVRANNVS